MRVVSRLNLRYRFSVLAVLLLPVIAIAGDLYSTEPWQSDFPEAVTDQQEAARPIEEAKARWEQMSDRERAAMMAGHHRAFVRGGQKNPDSLTAAQGKGEKGKEGKAGAEAGKKPGKNKK